MKSGLFSENDELIYYKDNVPVHAGAVKIDEDIYYIGRGGKAVKGRYRVHHEMGNGILNRGFYTFDDDGKLIENSFEPVKKSKYSKKYISKKVKKRIKKATPIICIVVAFSIFVLGMIFFQNKGITFSKKNNVAAEKENNVAAEKENKIEISEFKEEVLLCSIDGKDIYDGKSQIKEGLAFGAFYRPFEFHYNLKGNVGILYLSEYSDMSNPFQFVLDSKANYLTIDNLKTGTKYFYKVVVEDQEYTGTFKTAESTRYIKIAGVQNTRDIGGYTTLDEKTVKQGMIIRGTEIDGLVEPSYFFDSDYEEYVNNTFSFVYDFDLRHSAIYSGDYESRLGDDVRHRFYAAPQYGQIFSSDYKASLRQIFKDLANPNNYPMYLHCTYGVDRTGTVCFLLEGVLNLPEEVMINDYGLSDSPISNLNPIYAGLENYKGDTIQEKIVNFLTTEIGVTNEELESIREILLENSTSK